MCVCLGLVGGGGSESRAGVRWGQAHSGEQKMDRSPVKGSMALSRVRNLAPHLGVEDCALGVGRVSSCVSRKGTG